MNDLEQLIQGAIDGSLTDTEFQALQETLLADPKARETYKKFVWLSSALDVQHAGVATSSAVVPVDKIIHLQNRRTLRQSLIAAAAIILVTLISLRLFFIETPADSLTFQISPSTTFELTHLEQEEAPKGMTLTVGSRLQIEQGSVELTFDSGVKSIVLAPADLTLAEDGMLELDRGSAWFDVPQEAVGFTVLTKQLKVVDLGTQFGVSSKIDEFDEVHVFKGSVEVTHLQDDEQTSVLTVGEACRVNAEGALVKTPIKQSDYLTTLPDTLPYIHWSFDDNFQASGTSPIAADIRTNALASPTRSSGKSGAALKLSGNKQHLETDWQGFSGSRPRTVSFWVKFPDNANFKLNPGIIAWGDRSQGNRKWKVALRNEGPQTPTTVRLSWGTTWLACEAPLSPDQWHHVIATSKENGTKEDFPTAQIYINGKRQLASFYEPSQRLGSEATSTVTTSPQSAPLLIGSDPYKNRALRHSFNGSIDELYLFDGYMTDSDVSQWIRLEEKRTNSPINNIR